MRVHATEIRQRHRRQGLALGGGLALLGLLLLVWLGAQRSQVLDNEASRLSAQAQVVERNLGRQMWTTQQSLRQVARLWAAWSAAEQAERGPAWLQALADVQVGVRTLSVLDAQGQVRASNRADLVGRNFSDRPYFQLTRAANDPQRLVLSPPFRTVLGVYSMNLSLVLQGEDGRFEGVVTATLDPDYFELVLTSANYAPDMWSGLAHADGTLVLMQPHRPDLVGRALNVPGSLFQRHLALGQAQSFFFDTVHATGVRSLVALVNVGPPAPASGNDTMVVAVTRPEAAVLAQWRRQAGGAAAMFALLALVARWGMRWMQRAARESAEGLDRLERIGQTAPGVICQFALWPDGHVALPFATRPTQPYFGAPVSSTPGSADVLFSYIDPDQTAQVRAAIQASAQTLQPFRQEFLVRVPGEPARWLDVHSLPQRREDGSTLWTGLVMDATGLRQAREAQMVLESTQRASQAKSEFLSRASHELRTPLNAVIGFASLLLDHARDPLTSAQREQLGHIRDAGQHLLALINDLLDVSAIESGRVQAQMSDVALDQVLGEVVSTVREQAGAAGVQLHTSVQGGPLLARADRLRLKQVLLNLLSNAIKYNRPGGEVRVAVSGEPGQRVDIAVHDTGRGLSDAQRAHLFEPFNRLGAEHSLVAGTGIGLSITRMLVELMGGQLSVTSTPGQGSCFTVQLQASAPGASDSLRPLPLPQPPPVPAVAGAPLRVLYAEDNAMNARFVEQLLTLRPAMDLQVAADGAQALRLARQQPFDLALIDLHLGDMTGFDLLQALRTDPATAALRCVALTADAMPATVERARAAGFADFVTKPIDVRRLLALLDEAARPPPR